MKFFSLHSFGRIKDYLFRCVDDCMKLQHFVKCNDASREVKIQSVIEMFDGFFPGLSRDERFYTKPEIIDVTSLENTY